MHLSGLVSRSLSSKIDLPENEKQELRLAALLHDVGHGPFSHLIEEVMSEKRNVNHEDITQRVLKETEIRDIVADKGFDPQELAEFAIGLSAKKHRYMNEIIAGGLSVDIMDYLLRDSYFTGVEYGKVDIHRVINSFEIVDNRLSLDNAALYAFEALMIARYEMFRAVYFHRTVRAAEIMLMKAITLADDELQLTNTADLTRYISLTDETTLEKLVNIEPGSNQDLKRAKSLAENYRDRKLLKCVFERLVHRKDEFLERIFNQKKIRDELAREIARGAGVDPDLVYIDVPTTPSVPFTSARQVLSTITLVSKVGDRTKHETVNVDDLTLIGAISGFFNIIRVYTASEERPAVEEAANKFFGSESYANKISM